MTVVYVIGSILLGVVILLLILGLIIGRVEKNLLFSYPILATKFFTLFRKAKRHGWGPVFVQDRYNKENHVDTIGGNGTRMYNRDYVLEYRDGGTLPKYRAVITLNASKNDYDYESNSYSKDAAETTLLRLFRPDEQLPDWVEQTTAYYFYVGEKRYEFRATRVEPKFHHESWGDAVDYTNKLISTRVLSDAVNEQRTIIARRYSGEVYSKKKAYD